MINGLHEAAGPLLFPQILGISFLLRTLRTMPKWFYAVRKGRQAGIYNDWSDCSAQVHGYSGAAFKKFSSREEAESFVEGSSGGFRNSSYQRYKPYSSSSNQRRHRSPQHYHSSYYSRPSCINSCNDSSEESAPHKTDHAKDTALSRTTGNVSSRKVVYSDGCCINNGQAGATAGVGVYWGAQDPNNISEGLQGNQTNQRAEIVAACRAIETAKHQGLREVEVRTDSIYTIKAMTEWINNWKRSNWQTKVKNKDDFLRLHQLCQEVDVKWTHVPGHQGIPGNEEADKLAKLGSQNH